jgi:hypothetical protein
MSSQYTPTILSSQKFFEKGPYIIEFATPPPLLAG